MPFRLWKELCSRK